MNYDVPTPKVEKEPRIPTLEELRYKVKGFIEKSGLKDMKEERIFAEGPNVYFYEVSATDEMEMHISTSTLERDNLSIRVRQLR